MSAVMLNGVPGASFKCKRGVRQGDPLSPLLFVLAADLLQTIVYDDCTRGLLLHPLGSEFGGDYPIVQYADDTLIIMPAEADQLLHLQNLLETFATSTGLKVNFSKSSLLPINVDDEKATLLAETIGCKVGSMPFTYLGLPVGTTRPSVQEYMPMLNRIEKRIMGTSSLLTYAGRLIMVNFVLSALPTFYMCSFKVPISIIEQIDKYRMHFLWDNGDDNRKGGCLVAWKKACLPKDQGGLGIIDLRTQNSALLLKYLHKFYNKLDLPWVSLTWRCMYRRSTVPHVRSMVGSFWWRDIMSLSDSFRSLAVCAVNMGDTVLFWKDKWNLGVLQLQFPQLFSFVRKENISVGRFLTQTAEHNF